ncbi:unnamed protein product [Rangifer tarandus platyrhynchus]|uniref:Uncharacterized protein n=1 Tax=Rangifer tarandus platyrhynchus TaxID=3082113 RepID=A0AC60A9A0_RANTA
MGLERLRNKATYPGKPVLDAQTRGREWAAMPGRRLCRGSDTDESSHPKALDLRGKSRELRAGRKRRKGRCGNWAEGARLLQPLTKSPALHQLCPFGVFTPRAAAEAAESDPLERHAGHGRLFPHLEERGW